MGRVRSLDRVVIKNNGIETRLMGKILTQQIDASGRYWMVTLSKGGKERSYRTHTLVAKAFLPNDNKNLVVMHKDEKNLKYDKEGGRVSGSKKVICDGVVFDCVTDCADEYGIKACTMMSWLRGDRPMRKDFIDRGLSYA